MIVYNCTSATEARDKANIFYIETTANKINKGSRSYEVGKTKRGKYTPMAVFNFSV